MFKIDNRNTRTRCEICSKLTIRTVRLLNIVNFEQVNAGWDWILISTPTLFSTLCSLKGVTDKTN